MQFKTFKQIYWIVRVFQIPKLSMLPTLPASTAWDLTELSSNWIITQRYNIGVLFQKNQVNPFHHIGENSSMRLEWMNEHIYNDVNSLIFYFKKYWLNIYCVLVGGGYNKDNISFFKFLKFKSRRERSL